MMEFLDSIAQRYGVLPSEVLGETGPFAALAINIWAHNYGVQRDAKINKIATIHGRRKGKRR